MKKALLILSIFCLCYSMHAQTSLENSNWNIGPDSIHFKTDSFLLTSFGSLLVKGLYTDTVSTLRLADFSGPKACDSMLLGTYEMLFNNRKDTLNLTLISDDCSSRSIDLDGAVLTRKDLFISVNSQAEKVPFSFFPNPFQDILSINGNIEKYAFLQIFNMQGKIVLEQVVRSGTKQIDTKNLPSGSFIIQVLSDGIIQQEHLLKN